MLPVSVSRNLNRKMAVYTDAASLRLQKPEQKNGSLHRCSQSTSPETWKYKLQSTQMLPVYVSRNLKIKITVYTDAASLRLQKPE